MAGRRSCTLPGGDEKESVEYLLSKGADPTRVCEIGDTALGLATSDEVRTILETATLEFIEKKKKIKAKVTEAVAVAAAEVVLAELELKAEKAKKNEKKKRKKKEAAGAAAAALELQSTEAFNKKKPTATPPSRLLYYERNPLRKENSEPIAAETPAPQPT